MTCLRSIAVALLIALLAISVRADQGPGGGGGSSGGSGTGDDGGGSGSSTENHASGTSRGAPGGPNGKERRNGRSKDGAYTIAISGFYKGQGTATVTATTVTLSGDVKAPDGSAAILTSDALTISGPYFSGTGSIGGEKVKIKGRLDAARASRLVATYAGETHRGRIAGTLPTDPGDDSWDDSHHN
jgi:hypothetical protein